MEIINKSFSEPIEILKNTPIGFLVIEPEQLKFYQVPSEKKRQQVKSMRRNMHQKQKKLPSFHS